MICIPVLLIGGTEMQTLSLVRVLTASGYQVSICCYYEIIESVVKQFKETGAETILFRLGRSGERFGLSNILKLIRKLISAFRKYRPDIVHVQYLAPGLIPIIAARLSGIRKIFATVHQPGRPYGLKAKLFLRLGACLSTAFFCVSKSAEESWFGDSEVFNPQYVNRKRKHFTMYNAVDALAIARAVDRADCENLRESLGLNERPIIGVVGRLRSEKGHSVLLSAMVNVIKTIPDVQLIVVGDGPERAQLVDKAKTLGIADHVVWLGDKKPEEVFQLYGIMDVVAVPSLFEGFGLTAAEAMAAGRPVVASTVDGLSEVVEHGITGYLFPPGDYKAMAKWLVELLSDTSKAQAMGKAGKQKATQHFSMEHFAESITAAYLYFLREPL